MRTVCWAAVVAMSSACAAGHVDRERPVRDVAGSAGFGATQDTGEPPPETLPVAGQGDVEPGVGDGPARFDRSWARSIQLGQDRNPPLNARSPRRRCPTTHQELSPWPTRTGSA